MRTLDLIANEIDCVGWCFLHPDQVGDMVTLLRGLGPTIQAGCANAEYHDLVPYSKSAAPPGSMSSFVGTGAQPMHTDRAHSANPPRYVVLQCVHPGEVSCPTFIWVTDGPSLGRDRPTLLTRAQWVFHDGRCAPFYAAILEFKTNRLKLRFDPCCMRPASFCRSEAKDAIDLLKRYTRQSTVEWQAGSFLFLDNWRCLHARATGAERAPSRRLRRWYIGDRDGLGEHDAIQQG
jgi:hypothetical protein